MARPSTTVQAISDFIAGCKTDGVWSKITEAYLLAGVTFGGITVKLKGTGTLTNNNFVSGDYQATDSGAGLTGGGTTNRSKYLNANRGLGSNYRGFFGYVTNGLGSSIMCNNGGGNGNMVVNTSYVVMGGRRINFSVNNFGFSILSIEPSIAYGYKNGIKEGSDDGTIDWNRRLSIAGDILEVFSTSATVSFAGYWSSNSEGLTDTDASNLTNRVETLMDALGCGVIT